MNPEAMTPKERILCAMGGGRHGAAARDLTGHGHDAALTRTEWMPSLHG